MNIVREDLKDRTTLLKVTVVEADYREAVEKALQGYKRKANIPGFRPGMVPMGVINKMYRKGAIAEEAYRTASTSAFDYLEKENLDIVGDMIPSEQQQPLDFDKNVDHEFIFEVGIAPAVAISLGPKDKVKKYEIKIDDTMREGYRSNFLRRFGRLVDTEVVEKDEALTVTLDQEEMQVQEAYVGLISMNDKQRKPFLGKKVGDALKVDINELDPTPAQRASILQVKEEELEGINPKFTLTINNIKKFAEPELDEEFFKSAFPDGSVTDAKGFATYIDAQIASDLGRESDYMFVLDMRNFLLDKADLTMPDAFLKRWLFTVNEGKFPMEEIEKDFDKFLEMMRWNLIQKHYTNELKLEITPDEAMNEAKGLARQQFAYYGMNQVADEMLENYAKSILSNKEEGRKIYEKLIERKVIDALEPMVTVSATKISAEEFGKLVEKAQ